jgi:ribosomal protein S18 acetylase RimI-like enzyme
MSSYARCAMRMNYCFEVGDGAAFALCIPVFNGFEMKRMFSPASMRMNLWSCPVPPLSVYHLEKLKEKYVEPQFPWEENRPYIHLSILGVDPTQQGKGYGGALLRHIIHLAEKRGVAVTLETCTQKNKELYEHFGFEVIGELPRPDGTRWFGMMRKTPKV